MHRSFFAGSMLVFGALLAGCDQTDAPTAAVGNAGNSAIKNAYLLAQEPAAAKAVTEVKKEAKDQDDVIVVGRIGGSAKPFVADRMAFTIVDLCLIPCDFDGCGDPFCSVDRDDLRSSSVLVKFVNDAGQTIAHDAKSVLGVKELQTVVIRGRVQRDADANMTIHVSGFFPRP